MTLYVMQLGASFLLAHVFDWRVGAALWLLLLPLKNQLTKSKRQCAAGSVGAKTVTGKNCSRVGVVGRIWKVHST